MLHVVVWLFGAIGFLMTCYILCYYLAMAASYCVQTLVGNDCLEDGYWPKESKSKRFLEAAKHRYLGYRYGIRWTE